MTIQELFVRSNEELRKVVDQITPEQWSLQMPAGNSSKPATLADAIRYHTYDDAWVPNVLAGQTIQEVDVTYDPILSLPEDEIISAFDNYNGDAIESVLAFTDLDKVVHLSYGDFPARDYLQHIISFRGLRVYDIAKLIGADTTMADDLVQGLWDELSPVAESYRQMGVFPPAIVVPADAPLQTRLLGMVGRE